MLKKKNVIQLVLVLFLLFPVQITWAGIKVVQDDCPVFVSSHVMGSQAVQYPNGMYSMMGLITGFAADQFPLDVSFKTLTNFIAVGRYQPITSALVLSDGSGKKNMARYEFEMNFDRGGTMYTQIIDWKITFPSEGFYSYNVFIDGILVGYYPFYVWAR